MNRVRGHIGTAFATTLSALVLVSACATQTLATTYQYVGLPYTTNTDPANFGSNMTGTVTFSFDTTGVTGVFGLGSITNLQLTSGVYTSDLVDSSSAFTLTNGAITMWNVLAEVGTVSLFAINLPLSFEAFDRATGLVDIANISYDISTGLGAWTPVAETPLPAALPLFATGLGTLGLFGWRRKRRPSGV